MASNEGTGKGAVKRPSRLLNLNKSPHAQKLLYVLPFSGRNLHVCKLVADNPTLVRLATLPTHRCSGCHQRSAVVSTTTLLAAVSSTLTLAAREAVIHSQIARLYKSVKRHCFNVAFNGSPNLRIRTTRRGGISKTAESHRIVRSPARFQCTCCKSVDRFTTRRHSSHSLKHHSMSSFRTGIVAQR
jgi:hypothetical protein